MIPAEYERYFESESHNESWEEYCNRLNVTNEIRERYFVEHVIFDHYQNFTGRFPWFEFDSVFYAKEFWSARDIHEKIKYDSGDELDFWYTHVKKKPDNKLELLYFMLEEKTWPVPVVMFDFSKDLGFLSTNDRLTKFHLIEGTHRVSYLKKMLIEGMSSADSKHEILVLRKKTMVGM